jgi:epoxyqueuosine reductase
VRNVLIAIGNAGDRALLPAAAARLSDADPVVADAASWAVQRLEGGHG